MGTSLKIEHNTHKFTTILYILQLFGNYFEDFSNWYKMETFAL